MVGRIACIAVALFLTGCTAKSEYRDTVFYGMDTVITLRLGADGTLYAGQYADAVANVRAQMAEIEHSLSCHLEDAPVSRLNEKGAASVDGHFCAVWETAARVFAQTDGAYDPTLGALTALWNVNGGGPVPPDEKIQSLLPHHGISLVEVRDTEARLLDPLVQVDLGGVGKGYALERATEYLAESGIPYGIVSVGGSIGVFGANPNGKGYRIGVKDPQNPSDVMGYVTIDSGYISVSGSYERWFQENGKKYHHILDPATGYPAESGLWSVLCYTEDGCIADALSTALYVMGWEDGYRLYRQGDLAFEAMWVLEDNTVRCTPGLAERFALASQIYILQEEYPPAVIGGGK